MLFARSHPRARNMCRPRADRTRLALRDLSVTKLVRLPSRNRARIVPGSDRRGTAAAENISALATCLEPLLIHPSRVEEPFVPSLRSSIDAARGRAIATTLKIRP